MSASSRRHLQELWLKEQRQGKVPFKPGAAKFRDTLGDAEKTLPPEEPFTYEHLAARKTPTWRPRRSIGHSKSPRKEYAPLRSADQQAGSACTKIQEKAGEWALLDALEVHMFNLETQAVAAGRRGWQEAQRQILDGQIAEHQAAKERLESAKLEERRCLEVQLQKYQQEEARRAEELREKLCKLKEDRAAQVETAQKAKQLMRLKQDQEEAAELERIRLEQQLQEEKLQAKHALVREAARKTLEENFERLAARKEKERLERQQDEEVMKLMDRELERQEREREEKLKQFHDMVATRSAKVGEIAVTENKERLQKEEERIAMVEAENQRHHAARELARLEKQRKIQQDITVALEQQLLGKKQKDRLEKEEAQKWKQAIQKKIEEEELVEHLKLMHARERNIHNSQELLKLSQHKREARKLELNEAKMSQREQQLNAQILQQAIKVIGEPKVIPVKIPPQGKARTVMSMQHVTCDYV